MSLLDGLLRDALLGTGAAVVCLFSLGFVQTRAAETNTIVLPPEAAETEGGSRGGPFRGPTEYQLAYHGSLFQPPGGPTQITGFSWRIDGDLGGSFDVVVPHFEIWASTFQSPISQLSEIRNQNWGADRINVFTGENVRFIGTGGASPNSFDLRVIFDTPFPYDPAAGSLLLDIHSSGDFFTVAGWTDVDAAPGLVAMMVDDMFGPSIFSAADVLEISYIPEPKIMAIMTPSLLVFLLIKRRSR